MPIPKNPHLSAVRASNPDALVRLCRKVLADVGGSVDKAAERLGVSRRTLFRWMRELSIREEDPR